MMTVSELIAELQKQDRETRVMVLDHTGDVADVDEVRYETQPMRMWALDHDHLPAVILLYRFD